jgi:hypothetical protein
VEQHLHDHLAEFESRYNNRSANGFADRARAAEGIRGIISKRLTHGGASFGLLSHRRIFDCRV